VVPRIIDHPGSEHEVIIQLLKKMIITEKGKNWKLNNHGTHHVPTLHLEHTEAAINMNIKRWQKLKTRTLLW